MAKILIVEDEENLRLLYEEELRADGYEVRTAAGAEEAIEAVRAEVPDLIVMDIRMPGVNGLEAMERILGEFPEVPIILNTAYESYRDAFMSWSADAYVTKSSDMAELKHEIARLLGDKARAGSR